MTETSSDLTGVMDDRLAMLWYQLDRAGNYDLRRDVEEVADRFMFPGHTPIGSGDVGRAHEVFRRVHARYTPESQARLGVRLVQCPHCPDEEAKDG